IPYARARGRSRIHIGYDEQAAWRRLRLRSYWTQGDHDSWLGRQANLACGICRDCAGRGNSLREMVKGHAPEFCEKFVLPLFKFAWSRQIYFCGRHELLVDPTVQRVFGKV